MRWTIDTIIVIDGRNTVRCGDRGREVGRGVSAMRALLAAQHKGAVLPDNTTKVQMRAPAAIRRGHRAPSSLRSLRAVAAVRRQAGARGSALPHGLARRPRRLAVA